LAQIRAHRGEILQIAQAHGAHNVRIFGSVAHGQARPDSDVDFLVQFEPGRNVVDLSGLILDLQDALGCEVHVVDLRETSTVVEKIVRESIPL